MELRYYQIDAVNAVYDHIRNREDNPCVVIPTGGGKTPVIATICRDVVTKWNRRVMILSHVKELLEQSIDKLERIAPELCGRVGVYSAGLGSRETTGDVIIAGIQSVYNRACEFGKIDVIIIDEAHLIPPSGEGMYRTLIAEAKTVNPRVRIVGMTATPYRMNSGLICGDDQILNHIAYEIGVKPLIRDGYLCDLISKAGATKADTGSLHIRGGEFIAGETEELMDDDSLVQSAVKEIIEYTNDRNSCLIFSAGVHHGEHIARTFQEQHGIECGFVCGATPDSERAKLLGRFRGANVQDDLFRTPEQPLRYLCNVNVLTTGFDAPNVDCVVLLRPTMSPGLYYQMVGRGFRIHDSKKNCLVLDFGGNILRHGPVDSIKVRSLKSASSSGEAPAKECPECASVIAIQYSICPDCGYEFPKNEKQKHDSVASGEAILSGQRTYEEVPVWECTYCRYRKKDWKEGDHETLRCDYRIGLSEWLSEWVCFDHIGYARAKAESWWKMRSKAPVPKSLDEAEHMIREGYLTEPTKLRICRISGERFPKITSFFIPTLPEYEESDESAPVVFADDEIPF